MAALDLLDVVPPEGVVLLLVMTEPAPVQIVTARGLQCQHSVSQSQMVLSNPSKWKLYNLRTISTLSLQISLATP